MGRKQVIVVGAGVVGLATAYELGRRGYQTTLLERSSVGLGCSSGNAGWVTPAIGTPIAAPGLRSKGLRWFLSPNSPLYIKPTALPGLAPWLWSFWQHCSPRAFARGTSLLMPFAADAVQRYEDWHRELPSFEWHRNGLLMVFQDSEALRQQGEFFQRYEYSDWERLSAVGLKEVEPALTDSNPVGGIRLPAEGTVEPRSLCRALQRACFELDVSIREGFEVRELDRDECGRVVAVANGTSRVRCDELVIATGAEAARLSGLCGTDLPLQAGKGYSLTMATPRVQIENSLYLAEAKIGVSPFDGGLRVAGTLELSGVNNHLDPKRLHGFRRAVEAQIPGICEAENVRSWVGMRPLTPDGLPIVGCLPGAENVWVNSGHQMLGVTLAPASAALLADLVDEVPVDEEIAAGLSPARFAQKRQPSTLRTEAAVGGSPLRT